MTAQSNMCCSASKVWLSGLVMLAVLTCLQVNLVAQVHDSGVSDSALFDTVVDFPEATESDFLDGFGDLVFGEFPATDQTIQATDQTIQVNVANGLMSRSTVVLAGAELNVSGGALSFLASEGGEINISGGTIDGLSASTGLINITGGVVDGASVLEAEVNISGGSFSRPGSLGGVINFSGGELDGQLFFLGGELNVFGSEFFIDGVLLDQLVNGSATAIPNVGATLSGTLADGSSFAIDVEGDDFNGPNVSDARLSLFDATLSVTQVAAVPEPNTSFAVLMVMGLFVTARRRQRSW